MTDGQTNQLNQGWQGGQRPIGTGEGEAPLAVPTQNVTARTMMSDLSSIQSAGGGQPRPYIPPPAPQPVPVRPPSNPIPPFIPPRPATPLSAPQSTPAVRPNTPTSPQKPNVVASPSPKSSKKGILVTLVVALLLVALAALGYFVVFPLMNQPTPEEPAAKAIPPKIPAVPLIGGNPAPEPETPAPVSGVTEHVSLFIIPADVTEDATITEYSLAAIKSAFTLDTAEVPILREVVFKDTQGKIVPAATIVGLIDSTTFTPSVADQFTQNATVFSFTNTRGTWLGLVLKAKDAIALSALSADIRKIEAGQSLSNYFIADPGAPTVWKNGQSSGLAARYLTFAQPGAALNYGWVETKLVISASYDGFNEALRRLR